VGAFHQESDSVEFTMKHFVKEEEGATAVEYALMAGLIAAVIATTVAPIGATLFTIFTYVLPGLS
jgi:pilus assembly protein Flp/PilA